MRRRPCAFVCRELNKLPRMERELRRGGDPVSSTWNLIR